MISRRSFLSLIPFVSLARKEDKVFEVTIRRLALDQYQVVYLDKDGTWFGVMADTKTQALTVADLALTHNVT